MLNEYLNRRASARQFLITILASQEFIVICDSALRSLNVPTYVMIASLLLE
jgi:hypothetical protein